MPQSEINTIEAEIVSRGGQILRRFHTVLHGFSATIPADYVAILRQNPKITVEGDGIVRAMQPEHPTRPVRPHRRPRDP